MFILIDNVYKVLSVRWKPSIAVLLDFRPQTCVVEHHALNRSAFSLLVAFCFRQFLFGLHPLRMSTTFRAAILSVQVIVPPLGSVNLLLQSF